MNDRTKKQHKKNKIVGMSQNKKIQISNANFKLPPGQCSKINQIELVASYLLNSCI